MIAYLDSSVILRIVLSQPDRLAEWKGIDLGVSSALVEVECLRALDRFRISHRLSDREVAGRRAAVFKVLDEIEILELSRVVLGHAAHPMPVALGTLDAIHLATALLWRQYNEPLTMATHDQTLALAARALGFPVIGS